MRNNYTVRLTLTAVVAAIFVAVVVAVVVAMMTRLVAMTEFAVTRAVMKAAVAMIGALRLSRGHGQPQCGNKCQCKKFFGQHLSLLGKLVRHLPSPDDSQPTRPAASSYESYRGLPALQIAYICIAADI